MKSTILAAIAAATILPLLPAQAAIVYSTPGSVYDQNFDSLPTSPANGSFGATPNGWIDDTITPGAGQHSIEGWYLNHSTQLAAAGEGGANRRQRFRSGQGNGTVGAFYGYGTGNSTPDRALGMFPATTIAGDGDSMRIGLRITNNTGITLTKFTIIYDGEQYKDSEATSSISFSYGIDLPEATWHNTPSGSVPGSVTFVGAATFAAPVTNNPGTAITIDGNVAGAVRDITATVNLPPTNLWLPGTDLWLRWSQIQVPDLADDALAIDNVRFSAVPEPASILLTALAGLGIVASRRKR